MKDKNIPNQIDKNGNGIVRRVDPLGRLVIPKEIRDEIGFTTNSLLEMIVDGDQVIVKKYNQSCIFCGSISNIMKIKDQNVCYDCLKDIQDGIIKK